MRFNEIVEKLAASVIASSLTTDPELNPELSGITAIEDATTGTISYVEGGKFVNYVNSTPASALILPVDEELQAQATARGIAWLSSRQPRLVFAQTIALFYQPFKLQPEIHPTAVIAPDAEIGQGVAIGAHVVIQPGVRIGDGVCIHPNVVVYPKVEIGDRTVLHANCVIQEQTRIGADCVIHAGAVIGSEGFGFVPTAEGWYKMEQSGYVVLEDGVEVGCNSTIDRPAVGETRIGRQTKLDNLVHIAHGCQVGQNCAMAAQVGLAGGVKVGNRVILGGQVGVANQTTIGDGVQAGAKAGIHSHVAAGEVVMGYPALPHKLFLKAASTYSRLPEIYQTVRRLQRRFGDRQEG
jgi:UDP-3-O-[3-hydroxymyristoyl] glucosamine N-acyltransferase